MIEVDKRWCTKQAELYFKELPYDIDKLYADNDVQIDDYIVYLLEIETILGTYRYIGQTSNLKKRVYKHSEAFVITNVWILQTAESRAEALRLEKEEILDASDEMLLNKHYNIFYVEGTRDKVIKSISKHLIGRRTNGI